ncbi:hypothetical protein Tco_0777837 [Tanacetum coccineum]
MLRKPVAKLLSDIKTWLSRVRGHLKSLSLSDFLLQSCRLRLFVVPLVSCNCVGNIRFLSLTKGNGGGSVLDELIKEEEKAKERSNRKDYWLWEGIVVKVAQ